MFGISGAIVDIQPSSPIAGLSRTSRMYVALGAALAVLAVCGVSDLFAHNPRASGLMFGVMLVLVLALWMTRKGWDRWATHLSLGSLTLLTTSLLWINEGVRDPGILAYPAILAFVAFLTEGRSFLVHMSFMVVNLAFLAIANARGWLVPAVRPVGLFTGATLCAILLGGSLGIWLMAREVRQTLARLAAENQQLIQSQAHLAFLAHYDPLTRLPNRTLVRERLQQAVDQARRRGRGAALVQLDVDHFKAVNDSLGHQVGDQLLVDIADRIAVALRSRDTLSRQGGDEFLVVLADLATGEDAAAVAARILASLHGALRVQGLDVTLTVSMGIALFPEDGADFEVLLQKADIAMYQSKESGRNGFRFFDPTMNTHVLEHLRLASGLWAGLERQEFVLHYQPQIDLATGALIGAEALIRWQHPDLGLVPPGDFIPLAERSGQIGGIGKWALEESCRQARIWKDLGMNLVLAVNLSPVQFRRDDLVSAIRHALERAGLPASWIELELTESMLLNDCPELNEKLGHLRGMGLSLSIDDFGTGYSNLSYLQRFEVERLKIDQSFVRRLSHNPQDEAIVLAIIQMAKSLGIGTVAEGIEDEATLARLKALGCDIGQGFLWAKALAPEQFLEFARAQVVAP